MRRRVISRRVEAPWPGSMIDFLLLGWRGVLSNHECRERGIDEESYDWPAPWLDYPDPAAVWREHREWLMAEWRRRGLEGQPWAAEQFDRAGDSV